MVEVKLKLLTDLGVHEVQCSRERVWRTFSPGWAFRKLGYSVGMKHHFLSCSDVSYQCINAEIYMNRMLAASVVPHIE